jgi:hypothetical protein
LLERKREPPDETPFFCLISKKTFLSRCSIQKTGILNLLLQAEATNAGPTSDP